MLQLFEKWRVVRLAMDYVPSVGSTQVGTLVMGFDPDPTNDWSSYSPGPALIQRFFTLKGRTDFALWQSCGAASPPSPWLWTQPQGSDQRLYQAGSFIVLCVTGFTATSDFGALYMKWSVEAVGKTYNQAAFTATSAMMSTPSIAPGTDLQLLGGYTMAPIMGGGPLTDVGTGTYELGVPIAYVPNSKGAGALMYYQGSGGHITVTANGSPMMALPAGEYLVSGAVVAPNGTSIPVNATLVPVAGQPNWIVAYDSGSCSNQTGIGMQSTCIVEIPDDANMPAVPVDVSNAIVVSGQVDGTGVNRVVGESDDWGWFDFLTTLSTPFLNVIEGIVDVVEIVSPIVGLLLGGTRHAPNVRAHLVSKHTGKILRTSARMGLSGSRAERELLLEFLQYKKAHIVAEWLDSEGNVSDQDNKAPEPSGKEEKPVTQARFVRSEDVVPVMAPGQARALARDMALAFHRHNGRLDSL
jgi:hypothetical protein